MATNTSGLPFTVGKLREIMSDESDRDPWNTAWDMGITPWNEGVVQPPLREIIESTSSDFALPRSGRALVPGCGLGRDVAYIAEKLGLQTLGFDISEIAVKQANEYLRSQGIDEEKACVKQQDFFSFEAPASEEDKFALIYDYTFFSAIPPSQRNQWGAKMAALIKRGGYLITLVYPILPQDHAGPPYYIRPNHYSEPLGDAFEKVLDKVPAESVATHVGKEHILVWRFVG